MPEARALAAARRASVIAPAGCGKTELIARAIASNGDGRSLVLTHTHAGVKAIKDRLSRYQIGAARARVETIAGWCLRYAAAYPGRSGLLITQPVAAQWQQTYAGASRLLDSVFIQQVVLASYSDIYVDEYQDCTAAQHDVICKLVRLLPCRVLGDPLQGIFDFAEPTVRWAQDVQTPFPHLLELNTPWRWRGRNELLGDWLLEARRRLLAGEEIDLRHPAVTWERVSPDAQRRHAYRLNQLDGTVLALRKWPNASHDFGRAMGGIYRSMEEMECNALLALARRLPGLRGPARVWAILQFASNCMTGVREAVGAIWGASEAGRHPEVNRLGASREVATALIAAADSENVALLQTAARIIERLPNTRLFRMELWREFLHTLAEATDSGYESLEEKAWTIRNRHRILGRSLDRRTISRPLLIKGLECDHSCILDLDEYENARRPGEGAKNVYVALTRGSRSLTVLSAQPRITLAVPGL